MKLILRNKHFFCVINIARICVTILVILSFFAYSHHPGVASASYPGTEFKNSSPGDNKLSSSASDEDNSSPESQEPNVPVDEGGGEKNSGTDGEPVLEDLEPTEIPMEPEVDTVPQSSFSIYLPFVNNTNNIYYVSLSGSDQNPGSYAQPWRTIQKAANSLKNGGTVYIRGGTYNERVNIVNRTTQSGSYLTFLNYPGEKVILNGNGIAIQYGFGLFHIEKSNFIRVSGLNIQNSNGAGVYVGYSNNIQIDHNFTYDTVKSGIGIWASNNVIVDGNDIAMACNSHPGYTSSEENISIASGSFNVEVKNNYVHKAANIPVGYSGGEGINIKDGAHDVQVHDNIVRLDERSDGQPSNRLAFGLDGWTHETYNISFYNNIALNNSAGFVIESERGGTVHDVFVYNNIAYNNKTGFLIPDWVENNSSLKKNVYFINNTSHNNSIGFFINSTKIENIVIRNNIVWGSTSTIIFGTGVPSSKYTVDHNLSTVDPKFVNPAAGDFRLQNGSPAIDGGSSTNAPINDFSNKPRPQGNGYDIGAFEFQTP